jgi:hypothetical protein
VLNESAPKELPAKEAPPKEPPPKELPPYAPIEPYQSLPLGAAAALAPGPAPACDATAGSTGAGISCDGVEVLADPDSAEGLVAD